MLYYGWVRNFDSPVTYPFDYLVNYREPVAYDWCYHQLLHARRDYKLLLDRFNVVQLRPDCHHCLHYVTARRYLWRRCHCFTQIRQLHTWSCLCFHRSTSQFIQKSGCKSPEPYQYRFDLSLASKNFVPSRLSFHTWILHFLLGKLLQAGFFARCPRTRSEIYL